MAGWTVPREESDEEGVKAPAKESTKRTLLTVFTSFGQ